MSKYIFLFKKKYYNEYIILSFLIIAGFITRLYKINNPIADWHSFRQADTASVAREYVKNGINLLVPRYHDLSRVQSGMYNPKGYRFVEFPIYNAFHALGFKYIGIFNFDLWGRLISIICSIVTGIFLFLIGKRVYDKWFGLVASAIYFFLPYNIYFSRVILPEPMAIMFGVISIYCFVLSVLNSNTKTLYLSSVFLLLGVLVKPYIIFYGLPIFFYYFQKFGLRKSILRKDVIIYIAIVIIPFVFWRIWMRNFPEGIPFWRWTFNGDGIRFKPAFWYWIFGERIGQLILGSTALVPFGIGIISLRKKDYLLSGLVAGAFLYLSVFATANVRHDYYQSLIIPAICLLVAKGIHSILINKEFEKYYSLVVLIFLILTGFLVSAFQVKEFYKINHPEIIEAGSAVDRLTPQNAIVIANYNGDTAFLYQTRRKGWPVVELPINELIEEGAQYYVSVNFDTATNEFMNKYKIIEKTPKYVILDLTTKI